jgi:AcrR family transcriptional regulator
LVIAHPGHELRVHHWLELNRPLVFVLTDGSGHTGVSRLSSTTAVLARAGATPGSIYGRLADRELYRALLDGDLDLFSGLADELADALERAEIAVLAGDAVEGFNPGHDVCRLLINVAVRRLEARGRSPRNFEFPLEGAPGACPAEDLESVIRLDLDAAALERKLAAATAYPEMAFEVERALANHGRAPFGVECLVPVRYGLEVGDRSAQPPYYETYGERQVAAGIYREVIRFRQHLAPLAAGLGARTMGERDRVACASS